MRKRTIGCGAVILMGIMLSGCSTDPTTGNIGWSHEISARENSRALTSIRVGDNLDDAIRTIQEHSLCRLIRRGQSGKTLTLTYEILTYKRYHYAAVSIVGDVQTREVLAYSTTGIDITR